MERKKIFILIISLSLITTSGILVILSIAEAKVLQKERDDYLKGENIFYDYFSVEADDGISIKAILYVDQNLYNYNNNSVPTILMLHGINGRKEAAFQKVFHFVKLGYAVVSVELRGHGQSGGISSFYIKEPEDMRNVIDYMQTNFGFSNVSNLALLAFSYGGGVATILQAIDSRIHACVLYHPLASISSITDRVPFQFLLGHTPEITNVDEIQDGYALSNPNNTKNLLLLHGGDDDLILPEYSQAFYEKVNGTNRDDIQFKIRPGVGHGQNEGNAGSLKYTTAWFEHFYHNDTIDTTDLDNEMEYMSIIGNSYPGGSLSEELLSTAAIILFIGLSILLLPKVWSKAGISFKKEYMTSPIGSFKAYLNNVKKLKRGTKAEYKKMLLTRILLYIIPVPIIGIIMALVNPSFVYGYFMIIPIVSVIILIFIPSTEYSDWKEEWKHWKDESLGTFLYGIPIIVIPVLVYVSIQSVNAWDMMKPPIPFFTSTTLVYYFAFLTSFIMDFLLIRGWKIKHTLLLWGIKPLSLLLFYIFIPVPPFEYLGGLLIHFLILGLIGIVFWVLLIMTNLVRRIFINKIVVISIFLLPIIVFLSDRFFRIV
jgi:pimeloyl-ACP methyl ester carboxylesterase